MCTGKYIECSKVVEAKPKRKMTRRQAEVMRLHSLLPSVSEAQRRWMYTEPYEADMTALYWKRGRVWCQHCGHVEERAALESELIINLGVQKYVCPHCGETLQLVPYDYRAKGDVNTMKYVTVMTTFRGYQVFRTFLVERHNVLGEPTERTIGEIFENWLHPDGRETVISCGYSASMWRVYWHTGSEWSPKHRYTNVGYYFTDRWEVKDNYWYPVQRIAPMVKRNGWKQGLFVHAVSPVRMMQLLLSNPVAEMLAKTGQGRMLTYLGAGGFNDIADVLPAIRICNRNGYVIKNPSIWLDYVRLLLYFGKDIHNAHYVCPTDLKAVHDRLVEKKRRIDEREELAKRIAEAAKKEKGYANTHGRFFGIEFSGNGIMVHVVSSVAEMAEEGTMMHHCVFANEYYKRKSSLILSARDEDGNRLETVEVSTNTWKVMQSRGVCNEPTERHEDIVRLVEQNMKLFKKVA